MSLTSVCEVFDIAFERSIHWKDVKDLSDEDVYKLFYPNKYLRESVFEEPDWDYVHKEMASVGVNLKLLHEEYVDVCRRKSKVAMGYTKFCEDYGRYTVTNNLTKRIEHKAGQSCEVDWSGSTLGKGLVDPTTGEIRKIYLFVGVLPFSQKAYFEPTLDMKRKRSWLHCHVHMYEYWKGVPDRTICDNLKTGVIAHPREGEIVLNEAYEALGEHYMTAIMPTQVRKPKQKASAERCVRDAATWVIAALRNRVFTDFGEVQRAVRERLEAYNAHPFQKREGSRNLVFEQFEATKLKPLPDVAYDVAEWVYGRSVGLDFHIAYAKNRYSVPYRFVGCKVDLRIGEATLEIYHGGERIATHKLFASCATNAYSTDGSHMPEAFVKPEWDDVRIKNWAQRIGPNCAAVVKRIFDRVKLKEQAYNPALSVLKLSKRYGENRLESACAHALPKLTSPRYRQIKAILDSNLDTTKPLALSRQQHDPHPVTGRVRGADYYRD